MRGADAATVWDIRERVITVGAVEKPVPEHSVIGVQIKHLDNIFYMPEDLGGYAVQEALFQQGLDITLFGMGIVFTFLLLLVIGTSIMSRVIARYFPEAEPTTTLPSHTAGDNARLQAIIKAAIDQHRKKR
ncbi:OadG family protein [Microbulbifer sp. GL-2]|uniref:OadG family protein n=1 Tax=Microbulbifer sp. GL-2 TaxID=2591606 RepID=UPI0011656DEB|nr:OadG family transporter subunit [Microbulbifer sp. GL-2]BBM02728.1 hypothetical protein GL2_28020 [Microbulbifer sp. GL-2]